MLQHLKKGQLYRVFACFVALALSSFLKAQDVHVVAEAELVVFDQLNLNSVPATSWTTDRSNKPGYFSAINNAYFSGASNGTSTLIDGYVRYYRDNSASASTFTFPVGQSIAFRPVTLSDAMPSNASFAAAWFAGDPDITIDPTDASVHPRSSLGPGVISVSNAGFWDWLTLSGSATGMRITVMIPDMSAQAGPESLVLVGWDGAKWVNLSGSAGTGPYGGNWAEGSAEGSGLSGNWQAGISALAIGSLNAVLPLKLESFTGRTTGCSAELGWTTSDESNITDFHIQASADGVVWRPVGRVAARGNSGGKGYSFTASQTSPKQLYRLQIVDADGSITHSKNHALSCDCRNNETINISPNPTKGGQTQLVIQSDYEGNANLLLRNGHGQLLQNRVVTLRRGQNILVLETASLTAGSYFVSINSSAGDYLFTTQKIIKH